jgi:hypothetical protein
MNFQPRTEKEIEDRRLLPRGEYAFHIIEATETTSHAGNRMIELRVRVSTKNGHDRVLPDYILPQRPAKFRSACIAVGCEDKYLNGRVTDEDFLGKCGRAIVGVERAKRGWARHNVIVEYLPGAGAAVVIREGRKYA